MTGTGKVIEEAHERHGLVMGPPDAAASHDRDQSGSRWLILLLWVFIAPFSFWLFGSTKTQDGLPHGVPKRNSFFLPKTTLDLDYCMDRTHL